MTARLLAIGDIHGCDVALDALLDQMQPTAEDILVTLGDYVDRGPNSRGVIDRLIDLGTQTNLVAIKGNHEEMMIEVLHRGGNHNDWLKYGGDKTMTSYDFCGSLDCIPADHHRFLENLGDYFVHDSYFFTHAAYEPQVPLEYQSAGFLRWHSLEDGIPGPHQSGLTAVVGHTANK